MGGSLLVLRVFCLCVFLSAVFIVLLYQVITLQRAGKL